MTDRKIVVAAHGHCFDGLVSAAMFTHLHRHVDHRPSSYRYLSCGYGPNMQTIPERWLRGDENAIVDFRYTPTRKLTWYFDHHVTAFASHKQRDSALVASKRYFFDPAYGSCTRLIADVGEHRFGANFERYDELIGWADTIDSANFASAKDAIDGSHPVMQLAAVVEQRGNAELLNKLVPILLSEPAEEIGRSELVQQLWTPIAVARQQTRRRIAEVLELRGKVAFADLHSAPLEASGKFVAYALSPACVYSVALIRMKQHFKISVGYNPWCEQPRKHDIATLCQRWGGGGHPVVGAVSTPLNKLKEAQTIAETIIEELNR